MSVDCYPDAGQIVVEPKAGISYYSNCTTGMPRLPYGWSGSTTDGLMEITAYDSDRCTKIYLTRGRLPPPPPPAPGSPAVPAGCERYKED
eukprot:4853289-Pleurochrysis_carterae.AAC.1